MLRPSSSQSESSTISLLLAGRPDRPPTAPAQSVKNRAGPMTRKHTVPAILVRQLVQLVERWQISPDELLAGLVISEVLVDPLARLPIGVMHDLLERARLLTGEPGLGYHLALQDRVSTYGYIGLAASAAPTVRAVIDLAVQFAPLFSSALSLSLRVEGGRAFVRIDENVDLGSVRDIVLIHLMLGLESLVISLTGRREHGAAEMAIPEPPYQPRFTHLVPRWRFGQPANCFVMAAETLDWPIVAADPGSLELMRATCERALVEREVDESFVQSVRRAIVRESGGTRSLAQVADKMEISQRTLTRRLTEHGAKFSSLVEQVRRDQALLLLRTTTLSVREIARRLDYANSSTFVRAFRSWMEKTPGEYRRECGGFLWR
jgi:AraC-like DNA-binding protein